MELKKTNKKCNDCGSTLFEVLYSTRFYTQGDLYCKKCNM